MKQRSYFSTIKVKNAFVLNCLRTLVDRIRK